MKINSVGFMGLGKLGLPCALAIEHYGGHDVLGYDPSPYVAEILKNRCIPYREVGAEDLLKKSEIKLVSTAELVDKCDIIFVPIQTPHDPKYEGKTRLPEERVGFDYTYLRDGISQLAYEAARQERTVIVVIISTVLPGTVDGVIKPLLNEHTQLVYNPFFIAMGTCIQDFLHPEFILLGVDDVDTAEQVEAFYIGFIDAPVQRMSIPSAELTKVAYNTFITSKICIVNTLMGICHRVSGANIDDVTTALKHATDRVVSPSYMTGGMGDGGGCLPTGGLVLTEHGPRAIETIEPGDRVLARDGKLRPVLKRWERDYEGSLLKVKVRGQPATAFTPNHPMFVAEDGRPLLPDGRRDNRRKIGEVLSEESETKLEDIPLGCFIPSVIPIGAAQVDVPEHVTPEYCELAGWYLSEGWVDLKPRQSGRVGFALHIKETLIASRLTDLLLQVAPPIKVGRGMKSFGASGAKVTISSKKGHENSLTVRYGSLALATQLVEDFGKLAAGKKLPSWAVYGPKWVIEQLSKGMWQGDGCVSGTEMFFTTISSDLAYGAQLMLARFGITSNIRETPPRTTSGGQKHRRAFDVQVRNALFYQQLSDLTGLMPPPKKDQKLYTISPVRDGAIFRKVLSVETVPYKGQVWNLWIDEEHSYATPIGVVHNCHPRDNIAMSALARELKLPYDWFENLMLCREANAEFLADLMMEHALPKVILGITFKPETNLTTGSPALLVKNILEEKGAAVHTYDPDINGGPLPKHAAVYLIGCKKPEFADWKFPAGSVVIDPHRYVPDQDGSLVIRIGE